ncbi:MAG TPA: hypothetical protein VEC36_08510 [Patescibacteria group bacterium]|nr:hypothetical protein [Patescibacteria group bacterium]
MKLAKDKTILQLITHLEQKFGKESFVIEDYWDSDLCAIGLSNSQYKFLMYVSSSFKRNGIFHVEIEEIIKRGEYNFETPPIVFENIKVTELEEVFKKYILNN